MADSDSITRWKKIRRERLGVGNLDPWKNIHVHLILDRSAGRQQQVLYHRKMLSCSGLWSLSFSRLPIRLESLERRA